MSGLLLLDALAETRIEEAIAAGTFDDLPGAGRPLELDDERFVPEEVRAAYRILKRAGFVPPEIEARKECVALTTLIAKLDDCAERRSALLKLALIRAKLEQRPPRTGT
jgi:hypothetical protein